MKCRIYYRPTIWMAFDAPNPAPWRLDIPACIFRGMPPVGTDHRTFGEAVGAFRWLLELDRRVR